MLRSLVGSEMCIRDRVWDNDALMQAIYLSHSLLQSNFSSCARELWIYDCQLDLSMPNSLHTSKSFSSKIRSIVRTFRHTNTHRTDCSTWTTEVAAESNTNNYVKYQSHVILPYTSRSVFIKVIITSHKLVAPDFHVEQLKAVVYLRLRPRCCAPTEHTLYYRAPMSATEKSMFPRRTAEEPPLSIQ